LQSYRFSGIAFSFLFFEEVRMLRSSCVSCFGAVVLLSAVSAWAQLPSVTSGTLKLHLDAAQGVATSGGLVTQWNDLSGGNNHFEQTNAAQRPALVAGGAGGLPAIRFTSDRLDAVATHTLNNANGLPFTVFAVTSNTNATQGAFGLFDSAPGQTNVFRYSAFTGTNPNNPNRAVELWNADPFISFDVNSAGTVISTQAFVNPNANAANRTLSNRTIDGVGLVGKGAFSSTATQNVFLNPDIGSINGGGNGFYAGDVSEFIYFSGKLSVPDRFAVESYLRTKYGINAPLPGSEQKLPNPTIAANSAAFAGYGVDNALDGNPLTDYASAGQGVNTFIDFDFGDSTLLTRIEYTDRTSSGGANGSNAGGSGDNVTAFNLIFSDDAIFGNADDTLLNILSPGFANTDSILINGGDGIEAQFLRFDVVSTNGANVGAAEFAFFTTIAAVPEPASIVLWSLLGVGAIGVGIWRRRAK
jgi:hypothetical protein